MHEVEFDPKIRFLILSRLANNAKHVFIALVTILNSMATAFGANRLFKLTIYDTITR